MNYKTLSEILLIILFLAAVTITIYYKEVLIHLKKRAKETDYYNELSNKQLAEIIELKEKIEELEEKISATKIPGGLPPDEIKDMRIKVLKQRNRDLKSQNELLYALMREETQRVYDNVKY